MTRYAHASNKLLGIQIDAAINPGIIAVFRISALCCLETAHLRCELTLHYCALAICAIAFAASLTATAVLHCSARAVCETADSHCKTSERCGLV